MRPALRIALVALSLLVLIGTTQPVVRAGTPVSSEVGCHDFVLRLGGISFDPLASEPVLPDGWHQSRRDRRDLHLVQFDGPVGSGTLELLRKNGLEPVQYIHPHTYIVWGSAADRRSFENRASVRWSGDFAPAYRVQPRWRGLPAAPVDATVLLYRGAGADVVIESLLALGAKLNHGAVLDSRSTLATWTGAIRHIPATNRGSTASASTGPA
jgi:hypothetical protein